MRLKTTSLRDSFGSAIVDIGEANDKVIVLDADVSHPTRSYMFKKRFPDRFIQAGIAEQNMIGIAAGLATCGYIPIVVCFATFISRRCFDQVYNSVCYPNLNVKLVGAYCGITTPSTGASHQSFDDIAIMNTLPNMTILDVGYPEEVYFIMKELVKLKGPVYIRIGRVDNADFFYLKDYKFEIGKLIKISDGKDGAVISSGIMTTICKRAIKMLENEDISIDHYHLSTIKPINENFIFKLFKKFKFIFTVENHGITGGLGSIINNLTIKGNFKNIVTNIGIENKFGKCGRLSDLFMYFGLTDFDIYKKIKSVINKN